jgi:hypothetical protein
MVLLMVSYYTQFLSVSIRFLVVLSLLHCSHALPLCFPSANSLSFDTLTVLIHGVKLRKILLCHLAPLLGICS